MFSAVESVEIHENLSLQQENESEYLIPEFRRSPKLGNSVISAIMSERISEALTEKTRDKWYQNYTVPGGYLGQSRNLSPEWEIGEIVSAADAVGWDKTRKGVDVRPRLVDKKSGVARLIDSGSMITATAKKPGDIPDNSRRLVAVNGSPIQTYGTREIEVKIGRKTYN